MVSKRRWPTALLAVVLASCSDGIPTAPNDSTESTDQFLGSLPAWDVFLPPAEDHHDIVEPGTGSDEIVGRTTYRCTTTPYKITQTPDKIVTMDPDVNVLWLGALLQGRGYKDGIGSLAEWAVRERAPLRVSIDFLTGSNSRQVDRPDLASVNQAIGELVQEAQSAGHRGGSSVSYKMQKTYHQLQAGIALGLSMKYFGPTITASLHASRDASERTVTAYFVQRMFTASIVMPNSPGDMFGADFTPARLQEERDRGHVSSSNIPVYVANIVYGRSLLFSFTSNATEDSIRIALSASMKDDSIGSSASLRHILETSKVSVVTIGGEGRNVMALIQSGELADYFNEDAALTSARPISYTVRNLGDNSIAKVSETTEYQLKECEAVPTTGELNIDITPNDATVSILGPGGYSFGPQTGDQFLFDLVPGGYAITVARNGFDTATLDVDVVAGERHDELITLQPFNQQATGAIYKITPVRLHVQTTDCSGETQADVYHDIKVNGRVLTNRPESSSIPLDPGESEFAGSLYWHAVTDTVWFSGSQSSLNFTALVKDSDFNSADTMADYAWSYSAPLGTGNQSKDINPGNTGCNLIFHFTIEKLGDVTSTPP